MSDATHTEAPANSNRASAGYSDHTLLEMVGGEGYYTYPGRTSNATVIGHRDNHTSAHPGLILQAAKTLRGYGIRLRVSRLNGLPESLTVYGPK